MVRSFEQVRYGCWCNAWKEGKEKIITKDFCEGRMSVGGKKGQLVSHPSSAVCSAYNTQWIILLIALCTANEEEILICLVHCLP